MANTSHYKRKNISQYEAAFSPDPGYLLGETVWHYFKRPRDLIYCEAIPNTTEAILVIVKGGSVYLDGSFPIDSIPDELVVFRTQQNHFEIYINGDIPLSEAPQEGKYTVDSSSVKSFNILPEPIFPKLPTIKSFQLRLVDVVLKAQGIGVLPIKKIIAGLIIAVLGWLGIMHLTTTRKELPLSFVNVVNPYQAYINAMSSPEPASEIRAITGRIAQFYTIPGWTPATLEYSAASDKMKTNVKSSGAKLNILFKWAAINHTTLAIESNGVYLMSSIAVASRPGTTVISPLQEVIGEILDRISTIIPGNNLTLSPILDRGRFFETQLSISFTDLTLDTLNLLADQLKGLPLVLIKLSISINNGTLSGILVLKALGN